MRGPILRLAPRRASGQHPGLILARYLAEQNDEGRDKRLLFEAACAASRDPSLIALYRRAFDRWRGGISEVRAEADLQTPPHSRLIVGLGNKGVIEAGLRLHHTYGVPLIPGSALKGLASHYCAEVWGKTDPQYALPSHGFDPDRDTNYHRLLFGATDDSGVIRFEDAWLHPDSLAPRDQGLLADVMTPHHQKWQTDENIAPTDFDSPVPVPFLSVAGRFHLALSWQGPDHPDAGKWVGLAFSLLREVVQEWGVGGKTTSGYGRLSDASERPVPLQRESAGSPRTALNPPPSASPRPTSLAPNQKVMAVIVADPKGKNRLFAQLQSYELTGNILNESEVPTDAREVGKECTLEIANVNEKTRQIAFRWPKGGK